VRPPIQQFGLIAYDKRKEIQEIGYRTAKKALIEWLAANQTVANECALLSSSTSFANVAATASTTTSAATTPSQSVRRRKSVTSLDVTLSNSGKTPYRMLRNSSMLALQSASAQDVINNPAAAAAGAAAGRRRSVSFAALDIAAAAALSASTSPSQSANSTPKRDWLSK
jgi:hypothetical protein